MQDVETPMSPGMDFTGMNFGQLSALRDRIDKRVREMRETESPALRERFVEEAAAIGMTIEELVQLGTKRRGRPPREKEED